MRHAALSRSLQPAGLVVPLTLAAALALAGPAAAQLPRVEPTLPVNRVLTHREQAPLVHARIAERFRTLLPTLMRREGIDMWLVISREYNDDPVFRSMAPLETYASRRRTILAFHDQGGEAGVEAISVGRFD